MSLVLYSGPLSLFTAKVRIALEEKGLAYERIEVGWSLAERYLPHHPEVVRLNPKAEVPVLVDGDTVVYDSTQVLEYLEERFPSPPLYPEGVAERARCRRLEAWADEIVFPHVWDLIEGAFYPAEPDAADGSRAQRAATGRAGIEACARWLDAELAGRDVLCDRFSVADIAAFIMLTTAGTLGAPLPEECERVRAWQSALAGRPAVKRELEGLLAASAAARAAAG